LRVATRREWTQGHVAVVNMHPVNRKITTVR
jgi:hypothetical protein